MGDVKLMDWFDDLQLADCLATMRARMCVKRHPMVALDRYFQGVCPRHVEVGGRDDPATYMPPRRLWSRITLNARIEKDRAVHNKLAIMRHVRWVLANGKLDEYEWGRRFQEFAARIRARVVCGDFDFDMPISFAIEKPGKGTRFVTSFKSLEDKVILRQVARYLRKTLDGKLSPRCYSFREDASIKHTTAVKALIDYRARHEGEALWVAECDIRKFFDVIDHRVAWKAFTRLARGVKVDRLAKQAVKGYLGAYNSVETLRQGAKPQCRKQCDEYVGKIVEALDCVPGSRDADGHGAVGVPQGGPISMLIANWVLDIADRQVERWGDDQLFYARFCDDIIIVHPDRRKCRAARDRYLRTLERLLLPYHQVVNRIPYGGEFYGEKSKGPYCWRELRRHGERGASPWVSFLGNQVRFDGEVRVRKDSVERHVKALRNDRGKFLGLIYATQCDESGITMRKGTKKHPVTRSDAIQAMMKSMVAKGVGYLRSGPFSVDAMGWVSAFPDLRGRTCEHQLRQLDAIRAHLLYPLQKLSESRHFLGRPASYCGFLHKVERPAVGAGHRREATRIGYFEL